MKRTPLDDADFVRDALGLVAHARGMGGIAKKVGNLGFWCAHASIIPPARGAVQANWPEILLLPCPKNATPLVLHGCARASEAGR